MSSMKQALYELIYRAVETEFGADVAKSVVFTVEQPPKPEMGDYATNVAMVLAKQLKQNPAVVAAALESRITNHELGKDIARIDVLGGFINFTIKSEVWFREVLEEIEELEGDYGRSQVQHPEKIMVEYLSPNTNKPLHLGHLRNGITGAAVINALSASGQSVMKAEIINDRGVHICKAMLAYQRWGEGATPESTGKKPDHFFGDWYVRFAQEAEKDASLNDQAQAMLQRWEANDPEVRQLWLQVRQWVLEGWKQTEELLGFTFDKVYFESDVYQLGKDIIEAGLAKGVFRKNEKGNIVFDLPQEQFGTDEEGNAKVITVLRADGTSLYYTQDLGLQTSRVAEYHLDRIVHVVGSEQNFYFQALFAMFKALGYVWAEKLYHLSYAMVYLPEGKMKSREGTVVDADDLIEQMSALAKQEIESRIKNQESKKMDSGLPSTGLVETGMTEEELNRRAQIIALGAIKFYMLKQKPTTDIYFDPKESISFEGHTGPYCQYAYARARSILRGIKSEIEILKPEIQYGLLGDTEERILLQKLEQFPEVIMRAAEEYNPALIATHIFETAQAFNAFYTTHPVAKAETDSLRSARLAMVHAAAQVIHNGLAILGIETLEQM